ncbi:MAG: metallophosphoesterase [Clostridiales bacterium]|nr:metallophosphoesterase [Clostridiales bacterium]
MLYILLAAALLALFLGWQNNGLTVTRIPFSSPRLPDGLTGYTIVQISDLHSKRFGKGQRRLLKRVARERPHIIAVTGDIVSRGDRNFGRAVLCARGLAAIAPAYFIPGNHEADQAEYGRLRRKLEAAGLILLENRAAEAPTSGSLQLMGIADPLPRREERRLTKQEQDKTRADRTASLLAKLPPTDTGFRLLLAHRPELFEVYIKHADLTLSGHAHGGQVRLPGLPGLYAPSQGLLPGFTAGLYRQGDKGMIVSRGLGGKKWIPRIFNRAEIVTVTLEKTAPGCKNS